MIRTLLTLAAGIGVGVAGMTAAQHDEKNSVRPFGSRDIIEKLDGKELKVTYVEVTYEAGEAGKPHRHPGPAFGYVLEGEFEFAINDDPAKVLKAGETFYEPTGCLHRVTRSPAGAKGRTRVLAVLLHPRDAKQLVIPVPMKE